jgi:hypothetical protein
MMDGRSPRIHLCLTIWTLLLIGLVLVEIRHLPPGLTVFLVPYLALMARHWIGLLYHRGHIEPATPQDDAAGSPSDDEPDECADSLGSDGCSGYDCSLKPVLPRPTEEPATLPSRRGRARRRTRAAESEPMAASWVQVRPGRFVRFEEISPGHLADESDSDGRPDEPPGATPSDEPGATLEADSTSADANTGISVTDVEASHCDEDATDATSLSAR